MLYGWRQGRPPALRPPADARAVWEIDSQDRGRRRRHPPHPEAGRDHPPADPLPHHARRADLRALRRLGHGAHRRRGARPHAATPSSSRRPSATSPSSAGSASPARRRCVVARSTQGRGRAPRGRDLPAGLRLHDACARSAPVADAKTDWGAAVSDAQLKRYLAAARSRWREAAALRPRAGVRRRARRLERIIARAAAKGDLRTRADRQPPALRAARPGGAGPPRAQRPRRGAAGRLDRRRIARPVRRASSRPRPRASPTKETIMSDHDPRCEPYVARSTASPRCRRSSAARALTSLPDDGCAAGALRLGALGAARPAAAARQLARLAVAQRPRRRQDAHRGRVGARARRGRRAAGASPSWGAPGPTCATSWSRASPACWPSARPGPTPTTSPAAACSSGRTAPSPSSTRPRSPTAARPAARRRLV